MVFGLVVIILGALVWFVAQRSASVSEQANERRARQAPSSGDVLGSAAGNPGKLSITISVGAASPQEDADTFTGESLPMCQAAYAQVIAAIEAPPQALRDMFMPLVEAHRSGSPRQAKQVVLHYLPAGTWRWPAYAAMETTREREGYAASVQEIEQFSTEDLFARAYTVPQLLALYKLRAPGAKLPGRKKAEVLAAVTALLPEEEMLATAERIRANMLESLRQQHEDDLSEMENVADYGSMAQWLAHRFSMTVSALRRRNEILRMDGFYSHVEFQAYARGGAPAACQRLHGQRFTLDDPTWQNWQSCGFPECACGFRGLRPTDVTPPVAPVAKDDGAFDVDAARGALQKVAYDMVGNHHSEEEKAHFKQGMTEFAALDPMVRQIVERAAQIVATNPGLMQSKIYGHFPEFTVEQVRYALYFAHELGWIYRKKKGNSYQLFPPGETIDA